MAARARRRPGWRPGWAGAVAVAAAILAVGGAAAQDVLLPSGLTATLYDVVLEDGAAGTGAPDAFGDPEAGPELAGTDGVDAALGDEPLDAAPVGRSGGPEEATAAAGVARFRLVVPGLGGAGAAYEDVAADLPWLCQRLALPALAANGWAPAEVVVALSDREVAHGATDALATQFFEGYRIEDGACVPLAF